jgi:hypothetical protein
MSRHFRPLFPFQLGESSAPEIIGAWLKEAGNLVDLSHSANGPESSPLSEASRVDGNGRGLENMKDGLEPHLCRPKIPQSEREVSFALSSAACHRP